MNSSVSPRFQVLLVSKGSASCPADWVDGSIYGRFPKMVGETPTNPGGFLLKMISTWGVKWGYHHFRKRPYDIICLCGMLKRYVYVHILSIIYPQISSYIHIHIHSHTFSTYGQLFFSHLAILSSSQKVSIFWSSPWNIKTTGAEARGVSPSHCKSSRKPNTVPQANSNGRSRWRILTFPSVSTPSHWSLRGARWQGKKREVNLSWIFSTWQERWTFLTDRFCCTSWFMIFSHPKKNGWTSNIGSLSPGKHGSMKNCQY